MFFDNVVRLLVAFLGVSEEGALARRRQRPGVPTEKGEGQGRQVVMQPHKRPALSRL